MTIWFLKGHGVMFHKPCWLASTVDERVAYAAMQYEYWCGQSIYNGHPPEFPFEIMEKAVREWGALRVMRIHKPRTLLGWLLLVSPVVLAIYIFAMANVLHFVFGVLKANGVKGLP